MMEWIGTDKHYSAIRTNPEPFQYEIQDHSESYFSNPISIDFILYIIMQSNFDIRFVCSLYMYK